MQCCIQLGGPYREDSEPARLLLRGRRELGNVLVIERQLLLVVRVGRTERGCQHDVPERLREVGRPGFAGGLAPELVFYACAFVQSIALLWRL